MSERDLFKIATKKKFRFATPSGCITTEDLYDLPLKSKRAGMSLNSIAMSINTQIKDEETEDFVTQKSTASQDLIDKLELVKIVIADKLAAAETAAKAKETKAYTQKLRALIEEKKDEGLKNMSQEDLEKELAKITSAS